MMSPEKQSDSNDLPTSKAISDVMRPYCEKYNFDTDLCDKLEEMPPLHSFMIAYGYLSNEGLDARSILGDFAEKVGLHK